MLKMDSPEFFHELGIVIWRSKTISRIFSNVPLNLSTRYFMAVRPRPSSIFSGELPLFLRRNNF